MKKTSLYFLSEISVFLTLCFLVPQSVQAQVDLQAQINAQRDAAAKSAEINMSAEDPRTIAGTVVNILLTITGTFFLILMLYGGFKYLNAKGDEAEVETGTNAIKAAIIGFAVILAAYSITLFVLPKFRQAVLQGGQIQTGAEPMPNSPLYK